MERAAVGRRAPWMSVLLLVLLITLPITEVWLLLRVGDILGLGWILAIIILLAIVGVWLIRREGIKAWRSLTRTFQKGEMPSGELADAGLVLAGGLLLMLPGFITDVAGFFFLLPFTRPLARMVISFFAAREVAKAGVDVTTLRRTSRDDVVEGEVVEQEHQNRPDDDDTDNPPEISGQVI